jgi:hypothetical protein
MNYRAFTIIVKFSLLSMKKERVEPCKLLTNPPGKDPGHDLENPVDPASVLENMFCSSFGSRRGCRF